MGAELRTSEVTPEIRSRLATVPLLAKLDAEALDSGLARCQLRQVPAAVRIVEEGEYDNSFYIVVSGRCEVSKEGRLAVGGTVAKDRQATALE